MKKIDVGQTINTLANLGVIAGILFLGLELQQNNALMESAARSNRSAYAEEANLMIAGDSELAALVLRDTQGETLSELEAFRLNRFWMAALTNLQVGYLELSSEELELQANRWRRLFGRNPSLRETWAREASSREAPFFDANFSAWLNESVLALSP